jgi:pimeloyl-ACP methyl ester carboxylesterase
MIDNVGVFDAHDCAFVTEPRPDGNPRPRVLRITVVTPNSPRGAVLVLPGGKPRSDERSRPWQLAHLRVALLTWALRRRLGSGVEVRRVRYRLRGWNPDTLDAVNDATAALDDLLTRHRPEDVVVVGHSMGGRVAVHVAANDGVGGVVALAPWWPADDAGLLPARCRLLTMHGTADTWTDPVAAQAQTRAAAERGLDARWVPVPGAGHFLIRHYTLWHRETADFIRQALCRRPAS